MSDLRDMLTLKQATPVLLKGFDYWAAKKGDRPMPARADIDPLEIVSILPNVVLMDVLRDTRPGWPLDFRYRVMGTTVDSHMSRRFTGVAMSEVPHQQPDSQLFRNFARVVETQQPQFNRVPYVGPHKDFLSVVDLVMPLSSDGETVDMLMSLVDFIPKLHPGA